MKSRLTIAMASLLLVAAAPAFAQAPAPAKPATQGSNTQQERMKACNDKAAGKKGDERKAFMSSCLSGKDDAKLNAQQQKMKDCNARATGKSGDERKKFMSECLKA